MSHGVAVPTSFIKSSGNLRTEVQVVPSDSTDNPKHVYVNITAINRSLQAGTPANYQIDFDYPFVKDVEKYYLTIVKAQFPTRSIPLFAFQDGMYFVQIQTPSGQSYTSIIRPSNVVVNNDFPNVPFYIYTYQQYIDALNVAVVSAFTLALEDTTFLGRYPPFFAYINSSNYFTLTAEPNVWTPDLSVQSGGSKLCVDSFTSSLFLGLPGTPEYGTNIINLHVEETSPDSITGAGVNPMFSDGLSSLVDYNWRRSSYYTQGQVVYYNGTYYAATVSNTGTQPDVAPAIWRSQGSGPPPATTWSATVAYVIGNVVRYLGLYYTAIAASTGANPSANPGDWSVLGPSPPGPGQWQAGVLYAENQLVYYPTSESVLFMSLVDANAGNVPNPAAETAFWLPLPGNPTTWSPTITYVFGQNVYYPSYGDTIYTSTAGGNTGNVPTAGVPWVPATAFNAIIMVSEFSSLYAWSFFESIIIQTGSLPIRFEIWPNPQYAQVAPETGAGGQSLPRPILTDISAIKSLQGFDRAPVQYIPTTNYRMIDLFARQELKRIDSQIQWMDRFQEFHDLYMLIGDFFQIKYLFVRNDALSLT
jgi:hypothetical protein